MAPVALALEQEKRVTAQITELAALARKEGDLVAENFLQWFLKEQLEEVASMTSLLATVQRASELNILLAEQQLAAAQIGDAGQVDTSAPAAAGGTL